MTLNTKDAAAGALFMVLGAIFGLNAYFRLPLGTPLNMGPGYFPLLLSGVLFLLGLAIAVRAIGMESESGAQTPWRALSLILLGPVLFGATVQKLGFVPALTVTVFLAAYASRRMSPVLAVTLTGGLVVVCVLIFKYGLGSSFRLFGPWLGG